jgi:paraquat-inducible protein B
MKKAIVIFVFCGAACFSMPMIAQETTKAAPPKKSTEDLVNAAKSAKAKRKASSTKVITNKDVKKSKGKLIVLSTPANEKPAAPVEAPVTLAQQDENYRQRKEAETRVDTAQKKVDEIQKELDSIEHQYYEENDPNYRDRVIQERFAQTKRQLQDAQRDLADARDTLKKFESK